MQRHYLYKFACHARVEMLCRGSHVEQPSGWWKGPFPIACHTKQYIRDSVLGDSGAGGLVAPLPYLDALNPGKDFLVDVARESYINTQEFGGRTCHSICLLSTSLLAPSDSDQANACLRSIENTPYSLPQSPSQPALSVQYLKLNSLSSFKRVHGVGSFWLMQDNHDSSTAESCICIVWSSKNYNMRISPLLLDPINLIGTHAATATLNNSTVQYNGKAFRWYRKYSLLRKLDVLFGPLPQQASICTRICLASWNYTSTLGTETWCNLWVCSHTSPPPPTHTETP